MERSELEGAIVQWNFTCVEPANNHNKFWSIWLLQNGDLYVEYGRIGNAAQSKHHSIRNATIAFRKMDSLIRQKEAKGYRLIQSPQQTTREAAQPVQGQTDARSIGLSWD